MTVTATDRATEATRKRNDALLEAGPSETSVLADVRWLLCGRGRPVAAGSPMYEVAAGGERDEVRYQDIEGPRVAAEEREGLHTSMTRVVSFGPPPPELLERMQMAAEVDAAVLAACRPGRTLGDLFGVLQDAYARVGVPDEWRNHHQGGIAGYLGREVFATPGDVTELPPACAVAWNPSVAGGGKSEDTVLVTRDGIEVVTRTPVLAEVETDAGIARPAVVEL